MQSSWSHGKGLLGSDLIKGDSYVDAEWMDSYLKKTKQSPLSEQLAKAEHEYMMKNSENYRNHHIERMLQKQNEEMKLRKNNG